MAERIPREGSEVEIRQAFQRLERKGRNVDISDDTNLAATSPIVLTDDTLSLDETAIDHNVLTNTHNLTTDIDHDTITNTHNLTTDVDHNTITNTHNLTTNIDHDTITNTHNLTTDVDHGAITNTHNLTTDIDHGVITGLGDDDHTIYSLADGTRNFTGVVVGVDPVSSNQLATKEYVDSAISFIEEFFLADTASGVGSYFHMVDQHTGEAESSHATGSINQSDGQALSEWITVENVPGVIDLEHGIYSTHINVEKTGGGARDVRIYFEVWTRTHPGGSETLRTTSEVSGLITSKASIDLHAVISDDVAINDTDRVVVKFYANGVSGGNDATITLYGEGTTSSHFSMPISSEVLSTIFLRQDGTKSLSGNMLVDALITIDGRDISVDGTKLDGIESLADVTDATNVAAAGAAMSGGAFHDGFSDFVGNEHIDHTGVSIATAATSGISGGGTIAATRNLALNINGLTGESAIVAADTIPFYDATAGANRKVTLTELSTALGAADEKVKIDSGATAGYIGAASGDGVLRVDGALSYVDGGDYVTLGGSGTKCKAHATSGARQDIVTNIATKVTLGTEDFDIGGNFATSTFTAPADGYYLVIGRIGTFDGLGAGAALYTRLYVNSVNVSTVYVRNSGTAASVISGVNVDILFLESGDTLELYVFHTHGSNRELNTVDWTNMAIHRLS